MTFIAVRCPHCQSDQLITRGQTARGTQRSFCQNTRGARGRCLLDSCNRGGLPDVKHPLIDMGLNASGVRDTARSLPICPHTGLRALPKKEAVWEAVHTAVLRTLHPGEVAWGVERAGEAEMAELWAFVGNTSPPAGCGMRSLIPQARSWRTSLVVAKMRSFCRARPCWSPVGCAATPPIIGVHTLGIWTPTSIAQTNATRRKSRASI
jgi:hypothetical protein